MVGVILILVAMFVAGPIGVFVLGVMLSAAHGWLESEAADDRAATPDPVST
jgi:hypothetical protein